MEIQDKNQDSPSGAIVKKLILIWGTTLFVLVYGNILMSISVSQLNSDIAKNIGRILAGEILILFLVTVLFVVPVFFKVRTYIDKISRISKANAEQAKELKQSRLAAFSIMEDARKAMHKAEHGRIAAVRLAAIIESSDDAIIGKTMNGTVTSWNKGAETVYGYSAGEIIGKPINTIIPDDKKHELAGFIEKLRQNQSISHFETKRVTKDGRTIDVNLTISPVRNAKGRLIGASTIARDITLIKKAEIALREKEEWFRSLIENSSDLLIQLDPRGRITYTSPSIIKILGYGADEKVGHNILGFIHPDDLSGVKMLMRQVLKSNDNIIKGEARIKHKDGSWRWIEGIGHNLLHESSIQSIVINCRDYTEQKMINEQLIQNEGKFRLLVETTNIIPWEADSETFQFIYVGPQAERILGYPVEEWYSKDFWPCHVHPEDRESAVQTCLEKSKLKKDYEFEYRMIDKEGKILWFRDIVSVMPESRGSNLLRGYLINITERKFQDEKITRYTQMLKESNKELEQFAFVTSHDLQEPLRIISSYVHLLSQKYKGRLDYKADKYIHYVVTNTGRMQEMIRSLLEYSRLGRKRENEEEVDTEAICDQAIDNLAISIKRKNVKVIRGALPVIHGHKMELTRLFQNLISNAIKYCDKQEPRVQVNAEQSNGCWLFTVEDNGIGIDTEYKDQIFEVFKRLHTKSEYPGSGMGLAICKKIVEQNGGRIWVDSVPNQGSRFYFTVPLKKGAYYESNAA